MRAAIVSHLANPRPGVSLPIGVGAFAPLNSDQHVVDRATRVLDPAGADEAHVHDVTVNFDLHWIIEEKRALGRRITNASHSTLPCAAAPARPWKRLLSIQQIKSVLLTCVNNIGRPRNGVISDIGASA